MYKISQHEIQQPNRLRQHTKTILYIDPYDTHMDQKENLWQRLPNNSMHEFNEWHTGILNGRELYNLLLLTKKFHPHLMKSVGENKTNRFCFVLTLLTPGKVKVSESGISW